MRRSRDGTPSAERTPRARGSDPGLEHPGDLVEHDQPLAARGGDLLEAPGGHERAQHRRSPASVAPSSTVSRAGAASAMACRSTSGRAAQPPSSRSTSPAASSRARMRSVACSSTPDERGHVCRWRPARAARRPRTPAAGAGRRVPEQRDGIHGQVRRRRAQRSEASAVDCRVRRRERRLSMARL